MLDSIISLNLWAVFVATFLYFLLGALWYSILFADSWMKLRGISKDDIGDPEPLKFVWTFLLELVAVVTLGLFIQEMGLVTALQGAMAGFGAGTGLVFTLAGTTGLFSESKLALHFIDYGHHVVGLTITGAILGMW